MRPSDFEKWNDGKRFQVTGSHPPGWRVLALEKGMPERIATSPTLPNAVMVAKALERLANEEDADAAKEINEQRAWKAILGD